MAIRPNAANQPRHDKLLNVNLRRYCVAFINITPTFYGTRIRRDLVYCI